MSKRLPVVLAAALSLAPSAAAASIGCKELILQDWLLPSELGTEQRRSEAMACWHQAEGREGSNPALAAAAALRLAQLAHTVPDTAEALRWAEVALAIAREAGDQGLAVRALDEIGNAHYHENRLKEARDAFAEGYERAKASGNLRWLSVLAKDLGITLASLGYPEDAVALLEEARSLRSWWPAPELEVTIEGNLGSVWLRLGAPDLAELALVRALRSSRERQDSGQIIDVSLRLATLRIDAGDVLSALPLLEEVAQLSDDPGVWDGDREWLDWVLADALQRAGRGIEAVEVYQRRAQRAESLPGATWRLPSALVDLAVTSLQVDPSSEETIRSAQQTLERAAGLAAARDRSLTARLARGWAVLAQTRQSPEDAIAATELALAAHQDFLVHLPSPQDRRRWSWRGRELRDQLARLFLARAEAGDPRRVFEILELGRAQELADELAFAGLPHLDDEPRVLELLQRQAHLELEPPGPERDELLLALETEADALRRARRDRDRRRLRPTLDAIPPPTPTQVQVFLDENTAVLTLDFVADRVVVGVVSRDNFSLRELSTSPGELVTRLETVTEMLDAEEAQPILERLADDVLAPVVDDLPATLKRLVVVAGGPLMDLPFDLLEWEGAPLGQRVAIELAPSLALWLVLAERATRASNGPGLVIGLGGEQLASSATGARAVAWQGFQLEGLDLRPIPGAIDEARHIGRRFSGASEVWIGSEVSKARLEREPLERFGWLHFATHGLASASSPARSALWLGPSISDSGLLRAREIARLPLTSRLVVLSACRTAQRPGAPHDGVQGLARAFLAAGAAGVIASVRDVDDQGTAELMRHLYRELANGHAPARALQRAKLEAARRGVPRSSWSAFVLFGAGNEPLATPAQRGTAWLGLLVLTLSAALVVLGVKGRTGR